MNIRALGTGAILTDYRSSSFLVDGVLMLDCPNGAIKTMRRQGVDVAAIDACLLTHYHADHYFDVPFLLLELGLRQERDCEFVIAGPSGVAERIASLFELAYPEDLNSVFERSKVRFVEMRNGFFASIAGYGVRAHEVRHGACDALGYTISDGRVVAGFSGDTRDCAEVRSIVAESNIAFLDASFVGGTDAHMGASTFLRYLDEFGDDRQLMPTHLSDASRAFLTEKGVRVPVDGDVFLV